MKKKNNFIKNIFNFFDNHVILPITRLVFRITKKLSIPNKKFETWLSKQSTLLFISLFVAIGIFIVVDQKIITFSGQTAEVLKDQKINVKYNDIEGNEKTIRVREEIAVAFQHEIDHLNGILFVDKIDKKNPFKDKDKMREL